MSPTVPPAAPQVEAACVIVGYHRPGPLERLISALADPRLDVVVVNVEDDPLVRALTGAEILAVAGNVGYAAGVNLGARHTRAEVVIFMNDDVEVSAADVLLLTARVRDGHADVVVPLVEDDAGRVEPTVMPLPSAGHFALERWRRQRWRPPTQPARVEAAWAVIVAVRGELLRSVPLPEEYFLYWEEMEWFYRLRERGAAVEYNPAIRVRHHGGLSVVRPDKSALLARNAVRCVRRIHGRAAAARAWPIVVLWNLRLLFASWVLLKSRNERSASLAGARAALGAWHEI